jgi:hypothetical protein
VGWLGNVWKKRREREKGTSQFTDRTFQEEKKTGRKEKDIRVVG